MSGLVQTPARMGSGNPCPLPSRPCPGMAWSHLALMQVEQARSPRACPRKKRTTSPQNTRIRSSLRRLEADKPELSVRPLPTRSPDRPPSQGAAPRGHGCLPLPEPPAHPPGRTQPPASGAPPSAPSPATPTGRSDYAPGRPPPRWREGGAGTPTAAREPAGRGEDAGGADEATDAPSLPGQAGRPGPPVPRYPRPPRPSRGLSPPSSPPPPGARRRPLRPQREGGRVPQEPMAVAREGNAHGRLCGRGARKTPQPGLAAAGASEPSGEPPAHAQWARRREGRGSKRAAEITRPVLKGPRRESPCAGRRFPAARKPTG